MNAIAAGSQSLKWPVLLCSVGASLEALKAILAAWVITGIVSKSSVATLIDLGPEIDSQFAALHWLGTAALSAGALWILAGFVCWVVVRWRDSADLRSVAALAGKTIVLLLAAGFALLAVYFFAAPEKLQRPKAASERPAFDPTGAELVVPPPAPH